MMPKGLLDKLTRDEILDLVAYIAAGGNPQIAVRSRRIRTSSTCTGARSRGGYGRRRE